MVNESKSFVYLVGWNDETIVVRRVGLVLSSSEKKMQCFENSRKQYFIKLVQVEWKKYSEYHVNVDPDQDDKATEIKLCSFARPHMRAFHCSWWGFFVAFFIWFAVAPLLSEIRDDIGITKKDVWTSNIVGVGGRSLCVSFWDQCATSMEPVSCFL